MRYLAAILLCALLAGACRREPAPVPRPRAFARVATYGDSLQRLCVGPVAMDVCAAASLSRPGPYWLDAAFGRYGATMHIAVVATGGGPALRQALENRHQRMSLNLSGRRAEVVRLTSAGGFAVELVCAREPAPVPLQFVATDAAGTLVSGAVAFTGPVEPADSVAPALADLERQVLATVNSLAPCR